MSDFDIPFNLEPNEKIQVKDLISSLMTEMITESKIYKDSDTLYLSSPPKEPYPGAFIPTPVVEYPNLMKWILSSIEPSQSPPNNAFWTGTRSTGLSDLRNLQEQ